MRAWGAVTAAASREWPARSATESSGAGVEAWMGGRALIKIMKIPVFLLQLFRLFISIPFSYEWDKERRKEEKEWHEYRMRDE